MIPIREVSTRCLSNASLAPIDDKQHWMQDLLQNGYDIISLSGLVAREKTSHRPNKVCKSHDLPGM